MNNYFSPGAAVVALIAVTVSAFLATSCGNDTFQSRIAGIWDIDEKASWEFQKPGDAYVQSSVELWHDVSLRFDTKEQTCLVRSAFGSDIFRYRIVFEENNKATVSVGEKSFVFEFRSNDEILLCPSDRDIAACLILTKENTSANAEAARIAKAEHRRAEIIKMYTQTVASRARELLAFDFKSGSGPIDMIELYTAQMDAVDNKKIDAADEDTKEVGLFLETTFGDTVADNRASYGRVYTSRGTPLLSSGYEFPLSGAQMEEINRVAKTGETGQIIAVAQDNTKLFFEFSGPIFPPAWSGSALDPVGVLVLARPILSVLNDAIKFDFRVPQGNIFLIRFTGQSYQIIGGGGILHELQDIDFDDSYELPFARRNSMVGGGEVCSQASPGPAANSWILYETSCITAP